MGDTILSAFAHDGFKITCTSSDRAGTLMHLIGELSAEEASALAEAYRRLAGTGTP